MALDPHITFLCRLAGIENPIDEDDVPIGTLLFCCGSPQAPAAATITPGENKASRLMLAAIAQLRGTRYRIDLDDGIRALFAERFAAGWETCTPEQQTTLYWLKHADSVVLDWKADDGA